MAFTPIDPTKAEVRVTGTAPNQALDFYIPRGAKGEPGGFTSGTLLGATNLNTIITPGLYRQTAGANTTLANNYPVNNNGGILMVTEMSPGYVVQRFSSLNGLPVSGSVFWERQYANSVWTSWRAFNSTRVDNTAGRAIYQWDDLNGREQLIYGDTGWRDVTAANLNPAFFDITIPGRKLFLRRNGSVVTLSGQLQVIAGATPANYNTVLNLPSGFRTPTSYGGVEATALQVRSGTALVRILTSNNDFAMQTLPGIGALGNFTAGDVFNLNTTWQTNDPWPTTLPGTAVGSIPNL